jgi:hypothetical protein
MLKYMSVLVIIYNGVKMTYVSSSPHELTIYERSKFHSDISFAAVKGIVLSKISPSTNCYHSNQVAVSKVFFVIYFKISPVCLMTSLQRIPQGFSTYLCCSLVFSNPVTYACKVPTAAVPF